MLQQSAVSTPGLVAIVREFLLVQRAFAELDEHFQRDILVFADIQDLVSDGEESLLFRLKERCHTLFRQQEGSAVGREALFDLAVGALFHEAMKLREGLYQQQVYGPKLRALRGAAHRDTDGLFQAFENILEAGAGRLEETLREVETLAAQTRVEFRALLVSHREDGFVTRFLIEHAELAEEVFGEPLDAVLTGIHGSAGAAHRLAALSYLESGYFDRAAAAVAGAEERLGPEPELTRLRAYAEGMDAYLRGEYGEMVDRLERWLEVGGAEGRDALVDLAFAAAARVEQLVEPDGVGASRVGARATALAARIRPGVPPPGRDHALP